MFDDVKKSDQSTGGQIPNSQPVDNLPAPTKSSQALDDMFGDVDPVAENKVSLNKPSAVQTGKLKPLGLPNQFNQITQAPVSQVNTQQMLMEEEGGHRSLIKKILVAAVGIILLAIVASVAYYLFTKNNSAPEGINQPVNEQPINNNPPENTNPPITNPNDANSPENLDDDADGLTNADELARGTDPNNSDSDNDKLFDREEVRTYNTDPLSADSDNDGLTDYEEVKIWQTNPSDSDSDNDTFLDGVEVSRGYNPLGPGLLPENNEIIQP